MFLKNLNSDSGFCFLDHVRRDVPVDCHPRNRRFHCRQRSRQIHPWIGNSIMKILIKTILKTLPISYIQFVLLQFSCKIRFTQKVR